MTLLSSAPGRAGLATAVYAASEGLSALSWIAAHSAARPARRPGSKTISVFLPGITGMALMARAYNQAQKFGAEMAIPDEATSLSAGRTPGDCSRVNLRIGERVKARSVVIATGARYRRLDVESLDAFEQSSVHYWASPVRSEVCANQEVVLVGAGNSAGRPPFIWQARASRCAMLVRRPGLAETMSRYLVDRVRGFPISKS